MSNDTPDQVELMRKVYFPDDSKTDPYHVTRNFGTWIRNSGLNPENPVHRRNFRTHFMNTYVLEAWKQDPEAEELLEAITNWFPGITALPLVRKRKEQSTPLHRRLTKILSFRRRTRGQV